MTWFVEKRISWIKEIIEIFGFINREHVQAKFGISSPQASADIAETIKRFPDLMAYNTSQKQYIRKPKS
jgi:hypothetical protein